MQFVSYMTPGFPVSLFERMAAVIDAELLLEQHTSGPPPGEDPFRDGRYDLGWICSTSFVDLALRAEQPSVRLAGVAWVPDDPDANGRPVYFGDIVVAPDSDVETLDDLAGRRIGCNDAVSLSGHHALRLRLRDGGH
ncbi:MAG: PhnD/SsuA/transferrin family substrate-binding protein, partial [Acidimicrobiia bacterium]|nr:PhnD/SsuA/transferrin family substrate-binding protein [Acidimicrobiia bacterium]